MAASAVGKSCASAAAEAWCRLRKIVERHIAEGNAVAGEAVWRLAVTEGDAACFRIAPAAGGAAAVECRYDAANATLLWSGRSVAILAEEIEIVAGLILDQLVWNEK
jgi:hypothetical protein